MQDVDVIYLSSLTMPTPAYFGHDLTALSPHSVDCASLNSQALFSLHSLRNNHRIPCYILHTQLHSSVKQMQAEIVKMCLARKRSTYEISLYAVRALIPLLSPSLINLSMSFLNFTTPHCPLSTCWHKPLSLVNVALHPPYALGHLYVLVLLSCVPLFRC